MYSMVTARQGLEPVRAPGTFVSWCRPHAPELESELIRQAMQGPGMRLTCGAFYMILPCFSIPVSFVALKYESCLIKGNPILYLFIFYFALFIIEVFVK